FETAERVERREMRRRIEQRLMFVLSVQLDEPRRQLLQGARRRERAVDERTASTLRRDLAADQQFFSAAVEDGFDGGDVLVGPDKVARRAPAQEQADRLNENRFAGSGFACQDIEAGVEFHLDRVDDREVADLQKAEHEKGKNSNGNIGLTAISRVCYPVRQSRCPSGA